MRGPSGIDVLVVGGGSFGTSLASILASLGRKVHMWVRRQDQADELNNSHTNERYLPGIALPKSLVGVTDLVESVKKAPVVLMVVPSQSFRRVARQVGEHIEGDQILFHATKGFEISTFKRMSQILKEETCCLKIGVLSGPNLAKELMLGQPAGALIASRYDEVINVVQALFDGGPLKVFGGSDVVGTEIASAFKNCIAIAAGVASGLDFGNNSKSLLVTRGLMEMARLGVVMGGDVFTFGGLAGIGDLMATCDSPLSRNNQVGRRLAGGESLSEILESMTSVAEGVPTTKAVYKYAKKTGITLPIIYGVHGLLYRNWTVEQVIAKLMATPAGRELAALPYR